MIKDILQGREEINYSITNICVYSFSTVTYILPSYLKICCSTLIWSVVFLPRLTIFKTISKKVLVSQLLASITITITIIRCVRGKGSKWADNILKQSVFNFQAFVTWFSISPWDIYTSCPDSTKMNVAAIEQKLNYPRAMMVSLFSSFIFVFLT